MRISRRMGIYSGGSLKTFSVNYSNLETYMNLSNTATKGPFYNGSYVIGYVSKNWYWIRFKITPSDRVKNMRVVMSNIGASYGSGFSNTPFHIGFSTSDTCPNNVSATATTTHSSASSTLVWDISNVNLSGGVTYYVYCWGGTDAIPGGYQSASPTITITANP